MEDEDVCHLKEKWRIFGILEASLLSWYDNPFNQPFSSTFINEWSPVNECP